LNLSYLPGDSPENKKDDRRAIVFLSESREWDLNPRPAVYETAALPLSYLGGVQHGFQN
jgi:hypothetical protein